MDEVIFSDEAFEIGRDFDAGLDETYYYGLFRFQQFTDGAVIGPFKGLDWKALVKYELPSTTELETVQFADSLLTPLNFQQRDTTQFLIQPTQIKACNLPQ